MKRATIILSLVLCLIILHSCNVSNTNVDNGKDPVVTVKDKTLYRFQLNEALPFGLSGEDSIAAAQAYINMWINDQLIYDKASQNIHNKADIEALVDDYRKSLITNTYLERLLKERFSKSISDNDLMSYYEKNKDKFILEDNLIKGLYLKIPVNSSQLSNFQKWYKLGTDAAIENIEKNTLQNAVGYEYFYDKWVDFDDVMENIPSQISNPKQFLQGNKNLEVKDSSFVYLLNIKEYKPIGDEAPYEYIKGQLTEIFIEQQKSEYMKQVQKDLYDKALSSDEIKFYDK